jgi:N-methylhydantoinase B/oxoprolinase/acetone carboxylase alpha subunit
MPAEATAADPTPTALGIEWKVNITTVITVLITVGSAMWFVANTRTMAENASRESHQIAEMTQKESTRLENEIKASREIIQTGIGDIRQAIASLPDQRARVDELVRQQQQTELWKSAVEARLQDTRENLINVRTQLESIQRTSNIPIPPGRVR